MGGRAQQKRNRKRHNGRLAQHWPGPYFHGGAPGLEPGTRLLSSTELRVSYRYLDPTATYDPSQVYVTTDENVARAYAGRYVHPSGDRIPGDVYEVRPVGGVRLDPDYSRYGEFRGIFLACPVAEIVRVVARGMLCTDQELVELERPYLVWGSSGKPIHDENGWIIPSDQMRANGVSTEWTTLLRPWLRTTDVDAKGKLAIARRAPNPWAAMLDVIPSLDRDHTIVRSVLLGRNAPLRCNLCDATFTDSLSAAEHQLGERQVELIAKIHEWPIPPVPQLATAAARRNPARWQWCTDGTR